MFQSIVQSFSWLELVSLSINIILLLIFLILFKIGKFSKEFVEARTIENSLINYRIETFKTKMNNWMYTVIDKDNDKRIFTSKPFNSKLNLDREVLRKYENLDEVMGHKAFQVSSSVKPSSLEDLMG